MARTKRWKESDIVNGVGTYELSSWKYFHDFVYQEMLDFRDYIWRGQRCENWKLRSTLDRILSKRPSQLREEHLRRFQYATRGRRGSNPPALGNDNAWWALGQHHGLATPLLDWTESPFVASYFAFTSKGTPQTRQRVVFALHKPTVERHSDTIAKAHTATGRPDIVELVKPFSDENSRLVSQGGLFTRAPDGVDLEDWVAKVEAGNSNGFTLIKITIPDNDRENCLRSLNRMNINHLSLFPDLYGASQYCNHDLQIKEY